MATPQKLRATQGKGKTARSSTHATQQPTKAKAKTAAQRYPCTVAGCTGKFSTATARMSHIRNKHPEASGQARSGGGGGGGRSQSGGGRSQELATATTDQHGIPWTGETIDSLIRDLEAQRGQVEARLKTMGDLEAQRGRLNEEITVLRRARTELGKIEQAPAATAPATPAREMTATA